MLILLPLPFLGGPIEAWMGGLEGAGQAAAALAVVGLLAADVFLPVPSSVVATLAGHQLGFLGGAAAVWLGLSLGCGVGYVVGFKLGAPGLARFLGEAELERASAWLERRGGGMGLAISRAVPMLAEASVLLAGSVRARASRVAWICGLANAGVALAYAAVGALAAELELAPLAVLGSVLLPGLAMLAAGWRVRA